jgi:hypothetical protein
MYSTKEEVKTYDELKTIDYNKLAKEFWKWNKREVKTGQGIIEVEQPCTQALVNLFLDQKDLLTKMSKEETKIVYVACLRVKEFGLLGKVMTK